MTMPRIKIIYPIFLTFMFLTLPFFRGYSQNAYYDAQNLKKWLTIDGEIDRTNDSAISILFNYLPNELQVKFKRIPLKVVRDSVADYYRIESNNHFIVISDKVKSSTPLNFANISNTALSSIGGIDITNIADGFAKFIVKRTKEELSIAFFDRFKKAIAVNKDLQTVFPQTYVAFQAIDENIYMLQSYIQTLRESFEKDLASLATNLPKIMDNYEAFFNKYPTLKAVLKSGFYIAGQIQNKQHPAEIIENYPIDILSDVDPNVQAAFKTLMLISTSLKNNDGTDEYWASVSDIKKLTTDTTLLKLYLGLVEQKAKQESIFFADAAGAKIFLDALIDASYNTLGDYKSFIRDISIKIQGLQSAIASLKTIKGDSLLFENYYSIVSGSIDLMRNLTNVESLPHFPKGFNIQDSTKKYFDLAQTASDIVIDVNRRNYASAIVNSVHVFKNTVQEFSYFSAKAKTELTGAGREAQNILNQTKLFIDYYDDLKRIKDSLGTKDISALITAIDVAGKKYGSIGVKQGFAIANAVLTGIDSKKILDSLNGVINNAGNNLSSVSKSALTLADKSVDNFKDSISQNAEAIFKYGSFMAAIVQAKSSDDVESAIEAFALPSGSSTVKRETAFNVALNAYAGPYIGYERIKGVDKGKWNSYGITAPIGISISKGKSILFVNNGDHHTSSSIFISLVDLGAITAFRFTDDKTETIPTVQLKDIISPGLFYSHGFGNTPFSLNVGYQFGPLLRKVNADINNYSKNYSRFSISFVVDIPVLNFYTKSK